MTTLDSLQASLTYPFPTRFVCVFSHDVVTYAVLLCAFAAGSVAIIAAVFTVRAFIGFGNPIGYYWSTLLTHPFKAPLSVHPDRLRPAFNDLTLRAPKPVVNHSHPVQAALRSSVTNAICSLAATVGFVPYIVQRSKSDNRNGLEGCETVVWNKDAHRSAVAFAPQSRHLIALVDTSDYVDMNQVLSYGQPTVLYTVIPSKAASITTEYSYTFNEDSELVYDVKGGAHYVQELWDTGRDMVTATRRVKSGLYLEKTIFNIDRKRVDADHQIILFSPTARYLFPLLDLNPWLNGPLRKLRPVENGWTRLRILGGEDEPLVISTARVNSYCAATVPADVDDALADTANLSKNELQASTTATITKLPPVECAVLTNYHRTMNAGAFETVYSVDESVVRYQHVTTYDQNADTLLEPFMGPVGPDCYLPQQTLGNRKVAVAARVQAFASSITELKFAVEMALREAGEHIITTIGRHTLFPVTEDEVRECQPRPTQQRIIDQGGLVAGLPSEDEPIRAFEKAEPAQKVAAPRIISPDEPAHKLLWSRFMIPLHRAFVQHFGVDGEGWYAPGMTPHSIATRIAKVCESGRVTLADGNKWDSTICPVERAWEGGICYGVFHPTTHIELEKGLKYSHCCPVIFGNVAYEQLCGRGSGFADTTIGNTAFNMAKDYVAARTERMPSGNYRDPEMARSVLGIYMGDDSLSKYIGTEHLIETGRELGLVLEVEQCKAPEPGVNFISRFYGPYVWNGDLSSTCDVPRICSKLHVGNRGVESPSVKLQQRMIGLYLSDKNTPVVGPYASVVMELLGAPKVINKDLAGFFSELTSDVQFPNENVLGWMDAFWSARCPEIMLDLVQGFIGDCLVDPERMFTPPRFFRQKQVVCPPEMVTDAVAVVAGAPFPTVARVHLSDEERAELRESVNDAAKIGSLVVDTTLPSGPCRDCKKVFFANLLTNNQRMKMLAGEPFRCNACAAKAKELFDAKGGKGKGEAGNGK
jgi:hypothetical protein